MKISWANDKLFSKSSSISRRGTFTSKAIKKGELVAVFGGYIIELKMLDELKKRTRDSIYSVGYQVEDDLMLGITNYSQFSTTEYINHSCDPNCGFDGQINLYAIRDILKNEEVTFDYCMCFTNKMFEMNCTCGSSTCRKFISATDWKNPILQKKYGGAFQPYILKKIDNLNGRKYA